MKKVVLPLLFFFFLLFTACSDKETEAPSFLKVDVKTVNFLAGATNSSLNIQTNVDDWSATVDPAASAWLSASKQGGALNISATENDDFDVRNGKIIIKANSLTETINVAQLGVAPSILVSNEVITVGADGGVVNLEITSNIEYEIIIPDDVSWIQPKTSPNTRVAMVTKKYEYDVAWNTELEQRSAEVTIKQVDGTIEKKVFINQTAKDGYTGVSQGDIKDDIKVKVNSGTASSFQPNGGEIENSFDGDMGTLYHSAWNNAADNYFPITLDYNFVNEESIDYLIYHPRQSGPNGNFKETEIWVSTEEVPTFKKLMDYDFKGNGSAARVSFDKPVVKPKAIRFIVKSGAGDGQGFASCAEMEFYRTNPNNFDPLTLFTDKTCTELKPSITREDIEQVSNNLYRNMALYMLEGTYPREFRIDDYKAWPHPNDWARVNKTSTLSLLDNPTGISVSEGEELIVFVGQTHGYNLSLKIQNLDLPESDGYNNASFYPLVDGVNKIVPRNPGLAYVFYHTADYKTAPSVKIHFATGKVNGYYDTQKHEPADWAKYLDAAVDKYFDVVGEHAHLTFPTTSFRSFAKNSGPRLIAAYDDLVHLEKDFMGLYKYDRNSPNRAYFHVMYQSYMYATSYRTAYNESTLPSILNVNTLKSTPWGPAHEMGHSLQTRPGFKWQGMTEVTNNVHSLYVQTEWGNPSRIQSESMGRHNNRYEKAYYNSFVNNTPHPGESDVFCKLVSLWQLQLYFGRANGKADFYKDYYELVRTSSNKPNAGEQQLQFVKDVCDVSKTNLTRFFQKWGYLTPFDEEIDDYGKGQLTISQRQIDQVISDIEAKNYPEVTDMIEYVSDSNWEIFKNKSSIQKGTAIKSGTSIRMSNWKNVVAYEVYENDKLIFVSNLSAFNLDSSATQNTKIYAVAYNGDKVEVTF